MSEMSQQEDVREDHDKSSSQVLQENGDDMRIVERILRKRIQETGPEYRVKWLGFPHSENTWVPADHLDCPELIEELREKNRKKKPDGNTLATQGNTVENQSADTVTKEAVTKKQGKKRIIQTEKPAICSIQPIPKKNEVTSAAKKNDETNAFYEVESIMDKRVNDGSTQYKVKWKVFLEPTWEPASNLKYCDLLDRYEKGLKKKKKKEMSKRVSPSKSTSDKPSTTCAPFPRSDVLKPLKNVPESPSSYHPHVSASAVTLRKCITSTSDNELFGQLVVRKLDGMNPFEAGQAQVEILQIINKVKFQVSE